LKNNQFQAGYILDCVKQLLNSYDNTIEWQNLFNKLSTFEIYSNETLSEEHLINDAVLAIADNIISRGKPTKPSLYIEEQLSNKLGLTRRIITKIGDIKYEFVSYNLPINLSENIKKAICIIEPRLYPRLNHKDRLKFNIQSWEEHPGSDAEEIFFYERLPEITGEFAIQLLQPQRKIDSIIKLCGAKKERFKRSITNIDNFYNQEVDFAVEIPNANGFKNGFVIEIDGYQHKENAQHQLDNQRDSAIDQVGLFRTSRIKTNELNNIPQEKVNHIKEFFNHPYTSIISQNYDIPLYISETGLDAMQISLIPYAIARIQKTLIEITKSGFLDIEKNEWNLVFIERDVPCAKFAVNDFQKLLSELFTIEGKNRKLPTINCKVFDTKEFANCKLSDSDGLYKEEGLGNTAFNADIIIDISILQRGRFTEPTQDFIKSFPNPHIKTFVIRSAYSTEADRKITFAKPIYYHPILSSSNGDIKFKSLKYLLRNIFRKIGFRQGQLEILNRALQRKSLIALLPTGAGKSLTYQLVSFLQPGITLVIDPIKSLMKDQNDNLINLGIDNTVFINSTISSADERKTLSKKMCEGYYQFVFISPERLQIQEFIDHLNKMTENENETHFNYCVIDEAHCVSEWGHDFRTAYLRLGENARKHCKTGVNDKIPLLGLTGTASYDVLSNVQAELDLEMDTEAIIRPLSSERKELHYEVVAVNGQNIPVITSVNQIKEDVANRKYISLNDRLNKLPNIWNLTFDEFHFISGEQTKAGLVFCPHKGEKSSFGIYKISNNIIQQFPQLQNSLGLYAGSSNDDNNLNSQALIETQDKFKSNELLMLVCTKAFGMGIDKPNIRYTIHFNMPQSIESYYQEAGRSGRDREDAYCYILYSNQICKVEGQEEITVDKDNLLGFHKKSFPGIDKEKRVIKELLKEVHFSQGRGNLIFIDELILDELSYNVKINVFPMNTEHITRLYINGDEFGTTYGFITLNNSQAICVSYYPNHSQEQTINLLTEIYNFVLSIVPEGTDLISWFYRLTHPNPVNGIEQRLNDMNIGESRSFSISFENNIVNEITEYLKQNVDRRFNWKIVNEATEYCFDINKFNKNLKYEFWKVTHNNVNIHNSLVTSIELLFSKIRKEQDTFKAIYRLSLIGLIENYTVDYGKRMIKITIHRQDYNFYVKKLKEYIAKYLSQTESDIITFEYINSRRGENIIQKCLNYLIKFVYEKIGRKRYEAINQMEEACRIGIRDGNEAFQNFVNTYFDSMYYVPLIPFLYEYKLDLVWEYINITAGTINNLNHLRGATNRLLGDNPNNYAFLLLRAYANLSINQLNEETLKSFQADFFRGYEGFKQKDNLNRYGLSKLISDFQRAVRKYNENKIGALEKIILINQLNWFIKFNKEGVTNNA
jgi:RecQ family ATP-dependent DNA helicase